MVKIKSVNLETVCGLTSRLPDNQKTEVAFAGKSNVGKSSLINALICRKAYAHTSSQPGKTQTINYYRVNADIEGREGFAPDCYLVDLPGYGYATAAVSVKEKWGGMIERYLKTSGQLKAVFLLVDIRHEPSANDILMHDWILRNGMEPVIIATKKDKLKKGQVARALDTIRTALKTPAETPVIAFSAESKEGLEEIWGVIQSYS